MTKRIIFYFAICLLFFNCGNNAAVDTGFAIKKDTAKKVHLLVKEGLEQGIQLKKVQERFTTVFTTTIGDTIIYCSTKGKLEIADTLDHIKKPFFDLKVKFMLDKLYVLPLDGHRWFFVWQETSLNGIESVMAIFSVGNPEPEWKVTFNDPDPGMPVVDDDVAYVSTLGRVAKISLNDGHILWAKENLFNQYKMTFKKIDKAIVYSDKVIFVDFPIPGRREYRDSLILDPVTGERKK